MDQDRCRRCQSALPELAALGLARAQAREPHLLVCDGCRGELNRYHELTARLDAELPDDQHENLTGVVLARISREPDPAWLPQKPAAPAPVPASRGWVDLLSWSRRLAPAFGLALMLVVVVRVAHRPRGPAGELLDPPSSGQSVTALSVSGTAQVHRGHEWTPISPSDALQQGSSIRTARASRLDLRLAEGSRVTLFAETGTLVDGRTVQLDRGKARFEVVRDPTWPFRVRIPDGEVRVLGTIFEVEVSPSGSTRVTLLDGSLEVESRGRVERIVPGETATLSGGRIRIERPASTAASTTPSAAVPGPVSPTTTASPWDLPRVEARPASGPAPAGVNRRRH